MKTLSFRLALLVSAFALTSALNAQTLTLAAIPKSTGGEFWETVANGAKKAAKDLGVTLKWEGTVTETEIAEQNKIIENMVRQFRVAVAR